MKKLILQDIKHIVNSLDFKIVFTIYMMINLLGLIFCYKFDIGLNYQFLRSADENFILQGTESQFLLYLVVLLFPVISSVMCSFQKNNDDLENRSILVIQRIGRKKYLLSKTVSTFTITFAGTVIPLSINLILCHILYPQIGYDSAWNEPKYLIGQFSFDANRFWDMLRLEHSTLYNIVFIVVHGIFAASIALISLGLTMRLHKKAHAVIKIPIFLFITYMFLNILLQMLQWNKFEPMNCLWPGAFGGLFYTLFILLFTLTTGVLLIVRGVKKYEVL